MQPFKLIFAPLEGITDLHFRKLIATHYPEWDYQFTEFLRLSTNENYKKSHIINFFNGQEKLTHDQFDQKNVLQILTNPAAATPYNFSQLAQIGFSWIDLNLGCPSKQVMQHQGGAYLLEHLDKLEKIIATFKENFPHKISVKVRLGISNKQALSQLLPLFARYKIDLITIHGRTQKELYRGKANWQEIFTAANNSMIPIIGNGDIKTTQDIDKIYQQQTLAGVMIGRGAIAKPWLARAWKEQIHYTPEQENQLRFTFIQQLIDNYPHLNERAILNKLKKLTHYLFTDASERSLLLHTRDLREFLQKLKTIEPQFKTENS